MGQIFSAPDTLKIPSFSTCVVDGKFNREKYTEQTNKYLADAKEFLNKRGYNEPETGEVIHFPVADGTSQYMVIALKGGVKLMHLPLDDAWEYEYVHRLTAKDVRDKITQRKSISKIFGGKK